MVDEISWPILMDSHNLNSESSPSPERGPMNGFRRSAETEQTRPHLSGAAYERPNVFRQLGQQLEAWAENAEQTWTYRDVCSDIITRLAGINTAEDTPQAVEGTCISLSFCLRMARACYEREQAAGEVVTLGGVVEGLQHMLRCVEHERSLSADSVRDAIDVMILEISSTLSRD